MDWAVSVTASEGEESVLNSIKRTIDTATTTLKTKRESDDGEHSKSPKRSDRDCLSAVSAPIVLMMSGVTGNRCVKHYGVVVCVTYHIIGVHKGNESLDSLAYECLVV